MSRTRICVRLIPLLLAAGCSGLDVPFGEDANGRASAPSPSAKAPGSAAPTDAPTQAPRPDPETLLGRTPAEVQSLLGPPDLVRREGPAHVMQYQGQGCVLDVTLYEGGPGTPFKATYVESRDITGAMLATGDCLAILVPRDEWAAWQGSVAASGPDDQG